MERRWKALIDAGQLCGDRSATKTRGPSDERSGMKIMFFGKLRDALGDEREVEVAPGETVAQLRRRLADLHPHAASDLLSSRVRACVADNVVSDDFVLDRHERVEFLPPLSGG
jgi:molybdopterin converting factor small subunit